MEKNIFKILSVEDDNFIRMFLRDVFWLYGTKEGYKLQIVDNLKKAEEIVANYQTMPDLIFLDLVLPPSEGALSEISGSFKFLEKIKSNPETQNIKVIVFSGHGDKELKERAFKLGAEEFLVKGERLPKEVISATNRLLKNKN